MTPRAAPPRPLPPATESPASARAGRKSRRRTRPPPRRAAPPKRRTESMTFAPRSLARPFSLADLRRPPRLPRVLEVVGEGGQRLRVARLEVQNFREPSDALLELAVAERPLPQFPTDG